MKKGIATQARLVAQHSFIALFVCFFAATNPIWGSASHSEQQTQIHSFASEGCNLPAMNNVHVTDKNDISFSLAWDNVDGSAGYYLQIFKLNADGSLPSTPVQKQLAFSTTTTFDRLTPGTYRLVAAAVCEQDLRTLQTRSTPPTGDPTVTNIIIDEIVMLKTQPSGYNQTGVRYLVSKQAPVSLGVFDIAGREVISVHRNKTVVEGVYFETLNTETLQTGLYIVRLQVGKKVEVNKLLKM